jgi:hypothetical protein
MKEEEVAKLGELARIPEEMMGPAVLLFGGVEVPARLLRCWAKAGRGAIGR